MKKASHGGSRPNSGRKPRDNEPRVMIPGMRLPVEIVEYLKLVENKTATIEAAIAGTKAFKEWKRAKKK